MILSGTPIQNNLTELWSLFDFIFPGRLGVSYFCKQVHACIRVLIHKVDSASVPNAVLSAYQHWRICECDERSGADGVQVCLCASWLDQSISSETNESWCSIGSSEKERAGEVMGTMYDCRYSDWILTLLVTRFCSASWRRRNVGRMRNLSNRRKWSLSWLVGDKCFLALILCARSATTLIFLTAIETAM